MSYKENLEHINGRLSLSSNSEPLLSKHWYNELPEHVRDKDVVIPILAHGILRPDNGQFSRNHYFGGMLHLIQNYNNDLDKKFYLPLTCNSVCATITSHWASRKDIYQELQSWLKSENAAKIAIKIDSTRDDKKAVHDLCDALFLLDVDNHYLDCPLAPQEVDSTYKVRSEKEKLLCEALEILNMDNPYMDCTNLE